MASSPTTSSMAEAPPANFVVIPLTEGGQLDINHGRPCNSPDECLKAAEAFGVDGRKSVSFLAHRVYGQVSETRILWQPKGVG